MKYKRKPYIKYIIRHMTAYSNGFYEYYGDVWGYDEYHAKHNVALSINLYFN